MQIECIVFSVLKLIPLAEKINQTRFTGRIANNGYMHETLAITIDVPVCPCKNKCGADAFKLTLRPTLVILRIVWRYLS